MTLHSLGLKFLVVMPGAGETDNAPLRPSVFLSYASEDRAAASLIRDALESGGLEVWFDEEELAGGDAWDRKIRRQIRECDYFMPVISAQTEARHEGYFRREWRLAVERTLDMADDHIFLLPVTIDATDQASARVPEKFLSVQCLKLPDGRPTPALTALCSRLISGNSTARQAPRRARTRGDGIGRGPTPRALPALPTEEPGQRSKFWIHVIGWAFKSAWILFQRLPRWIRLIVYAWLLLAFLSRGCPHRAPEGVTIAPETAQKIKADVGKERSSPNKSDLAKLGLDIARDISREAGENAVETSPLLAVPFTAPADDPAAAKLADSTFALLYGRISISQQGKVGLSKEPLEKLEVSGALERGRERHSNFVLFGGVESRGAERVLTVEIANVLDGSVVWTKSFPAVDGDPAGIAREIEANVPSISDN